MVSGSGEFIPDHIPQISQSAILTLGWQQLCTKAGNMSLGLERDIAHLTLKKSLGVW